MKWMHDRKENKMALPQLTSTDVEAIVPNCKVVSSALGGGQKIVYPCCIDGHRYAVKFILLGELKDDLDGDVQSKIDTVRARVEREILDFSVKISIPLENTGVSSVFATSVWPFSLIFSLARRNEGNFFQAVPTTLSSSLAEVRLASLVAWA